MKFKSLILVLSFFVITACQDNKKSNTLETNTVNEAISDSSEKKAQSIECTIILSESLIAQGLQVGTYSISNNAAGGRNNLLGMNLIFNQDFNQILYAKTFDANGVESGLAKLEVKGEKGSSDYFEFNFNKSTIIQANSSIQIELR